MSIPSGSGRPAPALRRLTVQTLIQQSGSPVRPHRRARPWIRLSGKWPADAGFAAGDAVLVRVRPGRLVIERNP